MSAMKHVLIAATGGSAERPWLVKPVAELLTALGGQATVLVVESAQSQRFTPLPLEDLLDRARADAGQIAEDLAALGVVARTDAVAGPAVPTVVEYADRVGADLIAVGARAHGAVTGRLGVDLAAELFHRGAGRPLLVVAPPDA